MPSFNYGKLGKRLLGFLLSVVLVLTLTIPVSAEIGNKENIRKAMNSLTRSFSMNVDDVSDLAEIEAALKELEFSGIKSWSYEGIKDGDKIVLTWQLEWFDEHAVLAAYRNPALKAGLTKKQQALLTKCESIIGRIIRPGMSDYEKQLAIHDYIVLNCAYDGNLSRSSNITGEEDSFYAYGALITGKAVCSGYAEAAKLLLDIVGIENYRLNSTEHSWNLVKLNDGYYHMDSSWDDPEPDVSGRALHDYFNLTDAQIIKFKSHNWLDKNLYPKATATKYNYFKYNNLMANNYNDVKRMLLDAAASGKNEMTIFVSDYATGGYNWDTDLKFLNELVTRKSISKYSYSPPNSNKPTLTVRFDY